MHLSISISIWVSISVQSFGFHFGVGDQSLEVKTFETSSKYDLAKFWVGPEFSFNEKFHFLRPSFDHGFLYFGSGCSTAEERMPRNREVMGSNPAGCCAFSLLYPLSSAFFIQIPQVGATLLIFQQKNMLSHAA